MNKRTWSMPVRCCCAWLALWIGLAAAAKEKPFRIGVYVYDPMLSVAAEENLSVEAFIDKHFRILSENGVNAAYLGGTGGKHFDDYLAAAAKHGIGLIPQLNFAYFQGPKWSEKTMAAYAKMAGEFIARYQDRPEILAWSVKEEVAYGWIYQLSRYYSMILEHAPDAKFQLIHNGLPAARDMPGPVPVITGTDRGYRFAWTECAGGYLTSPGYALALIKGECAQFYLEAAKRGADFMFVSTCNAHLAVTAANKTCKTPATSEEQRKYQELCLASAADGRLGWRKVSTDQGGFYGHWSWYRPPENCVKAAAWTSVLEGAKLFFIYSYTPYTQEQLEASRDLDAAIVDVSITQASNRKGGVPGFTLAGRPGMPNPQLAELAEASREIRAYEKVITQMAKIPGLTATMENRLTYGQAFYLPTRPGVVLVLHNADVGAWPGRNKKLFTGTDKVYINDQGELEGYVPNQEPLPVVFTCPEALTQAAGHVEGLFDLKSGEEITAADGKYTVNVDPGSGVLLYLGTREQAMQLHGLVAASVSALRKNEGKKTR